MANVSTSGYTRTACLSPEDLVLGKDARSYEAEILALTEQVEQYRDVARQYREAYELREMGAVPHPVCAIDGCSDPTEIEETSLPLCWLHLRKAAVEAIRAEGSDPAQAPGVIATLARDRPPKQNASPAVYYVRMNEYIKIGTTTNLKLRFATFHLHPSALLAVEPGSFDREGQRHREFAHVREGRTELFLATPELLGHIDVVRKTFGDPSPFLR